MTLTASSLQKQSACECTVWVYEGVCAYQEGGVKLGEFHHDNISPTSWP